MKDERFSRAIEVILKNEGGYINDPKDLGGETKFGISKRSYPHLDIKNLTREQAIQIYRQDWWQRYNYENIKDEQLAIKVFDFAINMGAIPAHRLLQESVNFISGRNLDVDGIIGPLSLNAINQFPDQKRLLSTLQFHAARYYHSLVVVRPANGEFLVGWLNRAYS